MGARAETMPHRVNEVKTSKKFKMCFSHNGFPQSAIASFPTPLTNSLVVSAEAWTPGQPIWSQPGNKQGPAFLPGNQEPKTPSWSIPTAPPPSSCDNLLISWTGFCPFQGEVPTPKPHGTYGMYLFAQCTGSI